MDLVKELFNIKPECNTLVENRFKEFENLGKNGSEEDLFSELSFCVLTANWSAKGGIRAQKEIGNGFINLSEEKLIEALKSVGHRFPKARAKYIVSNRWIIGNLKALIKKDPFEAREYIVKNIKGISWKESSHFLRNCGISNLAILDKHIMRLMIKAGLLNELPKSGWSKKKYIEIEEKLRPISKKFEEPIGKLDLYMWFMAKKSVDK
ncbi:putative N-glycosylase/DNA lyase [Tepiditoga spiralis]|uniref:8-oxoguanine DNA glycosylase/AP lyase n=1 Tax=Tepiditoga spiralis TaxID=2108365 RepID=A0A7G1GA93_9BACT|nr:N-glycosylase/DNA lyase [Tepiditoga spiralis]BBE30339.1 putative N-glycosylase/DNA lyase [Tepiditoga spiralis]